MLKLLILDANVIIDAHRNNYWRTLIARFQLHIPKIIISESRYFTDSYNQKISINLSEDLKAGKIVEIEATPAEMAKLSHNFKPTFIESIDDGEREALAILYARPDSNLRFCTGDMRAIISLAVMGISHCGISLEHVLKQAGLKNVTIAAHFSEKTFQRHLGQGASERSIHVKSK